MYICTYLRICEDTKSKTKNKNKKLNHSEPSEVEVEAAFLPHEPIYHIPSSFVNEMESADVLHRSGKLIEFSFQIRI
jgi:hypothetical protein